MFKVERKRKGWAIINRKGWPVLMAWGICYFSRRADAETVAYWLNQ